MSPPKGGRRADHRLSKRSLQARPPLYGRAYLAPIAESATRALGSPQRPGGRRVFLVPVADRRSRRVLGSALVCPQVTAARIRDRWRAAAICRAEPGLCRSCDLAGKRPRSIATSVGHASGSRRALSVAAQARSGADRAELV